MNHPDREQNRATIYTRGWRSPKTSRSGLHPRRLLTSATSRRNPSRPWGAPAGAWTHRHIRGQSPRRVGNTAHSNVKFAPRSGRVAQRDGIAFTRNREQDLALYRPPSEARSHPFDGFLLSAEVRNTAVFQHQRHAPSHVARSGSAT